MPTQLDEQGSPKKYRSAFIPPLSLAILSSLTPAHHDVKVINDIVEEIDYTISYDLVALTILTAQAPRAYQIASRFREKGARIVIGGIHASILPEEAKQYSDSVVVGEVENIWDEILADCEKDKLRPFYKDSQFPDLQKIVVPDWQHFNLGIYRTSLGKRKMPRMPIYTTRGCVFRCKFCSVSKFFGSTYRFKPIENVLAEIDATGADSYFFVDDNIACSLDYAEELFKALSKKSIRWFSQCSVHILRHPHLIELAAKAGCRNMLLGIESFNRENLKSIKKGFNNPDQYFELFRRMKTAGIRPWVSMIYGLDYDTPEKLKDTVRLLKKANIWNLTLWLLTPLPGTDLYEELKAGNRIIETDWSRYDYNNVVFLPSQMSPEKLNEDYRRICQNFYSFPSIGSRLLKTLFKPDRPLDNLFKDMVVQIFFRQQVKYSNHLFSMGISPIRTG